MQTKLLSNDYQHISPAGAEVRLLLENNTVGMAHCTLKKGIISKAVAHKTVSEIWYVLSGTGEIWRRSNDAETTTTLKSGVTIDIPLGTEFQYRSSTKEDLVFICVTTPLWPGSGEIIYIKSGSWMPSNEI